MKRLAMWALALGVGYVFVKQWPEIQRYLKIESM